MLVSAPAGFGKTTLLTEWLTARPAAPAAQRLVAWLSLDRGDSDPASFWAYVIAALRTVAPGVGESALAQLHALQRPPIETVLTALLNDLAAIAADIVLVLDDYHVIDAREVQDGMAFLLGHLPPRLQVVIASRADPALPLARLRARGELAEIRAADLRFTPDEAAAYFNEMMGLQLAVQDVAALEGRTEGWIAALQLAALSMQGRADIAGFIAGFAGDDRYVVDYLFEEVLQRQPDDVQAFLLQTSILDELTGPLCDAVTGHGGGKAMLEALDRGNLFLVPLDDRRQWYRYHHLFADVLRARLLDEQPDQVPDLHRRASAWYERSGEQPIAIGHALAFYNGFTDHGFRIRVIFDNDPAKIGTIINGFDVHDVAQLSECFLVHLDWQAAHFGQIGVGLPHVVQRGRGVGSVVGDVRRDLRHAGALHRRDSRAAAGRLGARARQCRGQCAGHTDRDGERCQRQ
jgi:LuxR family maltose regulon positive regulatory protein